MVCGDNYSLHECCVVASVPAGPWAGAVLYSQDARLAGQGMDIHFDRMMWRGMFLKVNAYALNERTGMSTVASDVNHRWFKHIVLPSVLGGVGNVGSLYKDANTQILQGNYGSITGRVGMPDGEALAGVIGPQAAGNGHHRGALPVPSVREGVWYVPFCPR